MGHLVDFHCDLLSTPVDLLFKDTLGMEGVRCSPKQIREGRISFQICAVYTETGKDSVKKAIFQHELFKKLPEKTGRALRIFHETSNLSSSYTLIQEAIENASGLLEENESINLLESRIAYFMNNNGLAYIGPVWNSSNRFGGGITNPKGLTADGRFLLDLLNKFKIPVDLSHSCDVLIEDILDYINANAKDVVPIASHSNFRTVINQPRNLITEHAREILFRGGVIGLNFVKKFLGEPFIPALYAHIDFACELDLINSLCIGSDFFFSHPNENKFCSDCQSSSDLGSLRTILSLKYPEFHQRLLFSNGMDFIKKPRNPKLEH